MLSHFTECPIYLETIDNGLYAQQQMNNIINAKKYYAKTLLHSDKL